MPGPRPSEYWRTEWRERLARILTPREKCAQGADPAAAGPGLAAKAFAPASRFPSGSRRVTFSQIGKLREKVRLGLQGKVMPIPHLFSVLKDPRRVRKLKTSCRQLSQYLIHHTGDPAAAW